MTESTFRDQDLRAIAATVARVLGVPAPAAAELPPISAVVDTLAGARRLALVVIDGFGTHVWQGVVDRVPTLNRLRDAHHTEISSVVPSYTYICLSTMLTGVSPASHGVTGLSDMVAAARQAGVETVFDGVRRSGGHSLLAVHRRDVEGVPVERFVEHTLLAKERVDEEIYARVPEMLTGERPTFAFIHLLDVDEAAHAHGPSSAEVSDAAARTDARLRPLLRDLARLDYAVVLLADHGQHDSGDGQQKGTHDGSCEEDLRVTVVWATAEELGALGADGQP